MDHHPGHPVGAAGGDRQAVLQALEAPARDVDAGDVGAQQFPRRVPAGEVGADQAAYGALLAVAGDQVAAAQPQRPSVRAGGFGLHQVAAVVERGQFVLALQFGAQ